MNLVFIQLQQEYNNHENSVYHGERKYGDVSQFLQLLLDTFLRENNTVSFVQYIKYCTLTCFKHKITFCTNLNSLSITIMAMYLRYQYISGN